MAVSGYFNPLHVGHLEMIEKAKKLGDKLVVIINNDRQVALKGSVPFMSEKDRTTIIKALRAVDQVMLSVDTDKTVIKSLAKLKPTIFANGGDRHSINDVPEYDVKPRRDTSFQCRLDAFFYPLGCQCLVHVLQRGIVV